MAGTLFSPTPSPVSFSIDRRDVFADYPRDNDLRVESSEEGDITSGHDDAKAAEERRAEIERLAQSALSNSRLSIKRDDQSGDFVYIMIDEKTGEAVRRWPPESHADLVDYLRDKTGGLVDKTA